MTEFPGRYYLLNGDDSTLALERTSGNNVVLATSKFKSDGTPVDPDDSSWKYQAWEIPRTSRNFRGARRHHLLNYSDLNQALDLSHGLPASNTNVITFPLNSSHDLAGYPDVPLGQSAAPNTIQKFNQLWILQGTGSADTYNLINFLAGTYVDRSGNNAVGNPANNRPVQKWTLKKVEEPSL